MSRRGRRSNERIVHVRNPHTGRLRRRNRSSLELGAADGLVISARSLRSESLDGLFISGQRS
jgi:hypothetical protein